MLEVGDTQLEWERKVPVIRSSGEQEFPPWLLGSYTPQLDSGWRSNY